MSLSLIANLHSQTLKISWGPTSQKPRIIPRKMKDESPYDRLNISSYELNLFDDGYVIAWVRSASTAVYL